MAIERASVADSIGVKSGMGLSTKFRTELPDPGAATMAGAQQLSSTMESIGAKDMEQKATKEASDAAYAQPLTKDPTTGQYALPQAPTSYGAGAAKVFDDIANTRTTQAAYFDITDGLAQDALAKRDDPAGARAIMQARVDGALKGMDPRIAGQLGPKLNAAVAEHANGVAATVARKDDASQITALDDNNTRLRSQISDLSAVANGPDSKAAQEAAAQIEDLRNQIAGNLHLLASKHVIDGEAAFKREGEIQQGLTAAGNIMQVMKSKIDDGTLTPMDLDDLSRVSRGLVGEKENILGFTGEWIRENLKDPATRQALAANLAQTKAAMSSSFSARAADQQYKQIEQGIDQGARRFPYGISAEQKEQHILRYAQENKIDPLDPNGAQAIFDRYGEMPGKLYAQAFSGIAGRDPKEIQSRMQLWQRLGNLQTQDGDTTSARDAISERDNAFMAHVEMNGADQESIMYARKAVREGLTGGNAEKAEASLSSMKMEDYKTALAKGIPNGRWGNETWGDLPPEGQKLMRDTALKYRLMNIPEDKAMTMAAQRFKEVYTQAPDYMMVSGARSGSTGWIRKDQMVRGVSTVDDPKASTTGYLQKNLSALFDPKGERDVAFTDVNGVVQTKKAGTDDGAVTDPSLTFSSLQGGKKVPVPANAKLGRDLFLQPATGRATIDKDGNSTQAYTVWTKDGSGVAHPVLNDKTGVALTITPNKAAGYEEANLQTQRDERNRLAIDADKQTMELVKKGGAAGGVMPIVPPKALPEQKDLPANVYHILPDDPQGLAGERGMKPATGAAARGTIMNGGRVDDAPVRGAITIPSMYAPKPDPDAPAPRAGEISGQGWPIPDKLKGVQTSMGSNTAVAVDYFLRRGYSPAQTAGIVGNLFHESARTMNPNATGKNDAGPGLNSVGIGQWNRDRLANLTRFASQNGVDPRNLGTQLAFIEHEMHTSEYTTKVRLGNAGSVDQAVATFATSYERPQGFQYGFASTAGAASRLAAARKIFSMIGA